MACSCVWTDNPNGQGKILYAKDMCQECIDARAAQKEIDDAAELVKKEEAEKEALIQKKIRDVAIASLTIEGKLDNDGKLIKG